MITYKVYRLDEKNDIAYTYMYCRFDFIASDYQTIRDMLTLYKPIFEVSYDDLEKTSDIARLERFLIHYNDQLSDASGKPLVTSDVICISDTQSDRYFYHEIDRSWIQLEA